MIERTHERGRETEGSLYSLWRRKNAPEEVTEMYQWKDREGKREKDGLGSTRNIERGCKEDRARAVVAATAAAAATVVAVVGKA